MAKSVWQAMKDLAGTSQPPPAAEMLRDLFGVGRRGGPDTARAAQRLGVSRSTIQRWARTGLPNTPTARRLQTRHRRWLNETKAGRAKTTDRIAQRGGIAVTFHGKVRISNDSRNNQARHFSYTLTPGNTDLLTGVAATGDRTDLHAAFEYVTTDEVFRGGSAQLDINDVFFN